MCYFKDIQLKKETTKLTADKGNNQLMRKEPLKQLLCVDKAVPQLNGTIFNKFNVLKFEYFI